VDTVVGLILLGVYIVAIVSLAAGVTWVVVKLFPTERDGDKPSQNGKKAATGDETAPSGRLFRRAKRGA
jgi:hypothetical protein